MPCLLKITLPSQLNIVLNVNTICPFLNSHEIDAPLMALNNGAKHAGTLLNKQEHARKKNPSKP
jgi:CMP-2-keto-3-deoxyoctulosonic acid synthetase